MLGVGLIAEWSKTLGVGPHFSVAILGAAGKMKLQDLSPKDVQTLSLDENKLTVVLAEDRIETFTFRDRQEVEEAIRFWLLSRKIRSLFKI